jgi:hypothetical protein
MLMSAGLPLKLTSENGRRGVADSCCAIRTCLSLPWFRGKSRRLVAYKFPEAFTPLLVSVDPFGQSPGTNYAVSHL